MAPADRGRGKPLISLGYTWSNTWLFQPSYLQGAVIVAHVCFLDYLTVDN